MTAPGGSVRDAVQQAYLQALTRRSQAAEGPVRVVLEARMQTPQPSRGEALPAGDVGGHGKGHSKAPATPAQKAQGQRSALAELTQQLTRASRPDAASTPAAQDAAAAGELRSVRGFSEVWSKIAAETEVTQALARKPANAGPLNSHMLVLRSLGLMRELSPDYLRRFMAHVDALLWLEQVAGAQKAAASKVGARRQKG